MLLGPFILPHLLPGTRGLAGAAEGLTVQQPGRTCVQILPLSSPSRVASNKRCDSLGFSSFSVK